MTGTWVAVSAGSATSDRSVAVVSSELRCAMYVVANLSVSNLDSLVSAGTHGSVVLSLPNALLSTRIRALSLALAAFLGQPSSSKSCCCSRCCCSNHQSGLRLPMSHLQHNTIGVYYILLVRV